MTAVVVVAMTAVVVAEMTAVEVVVAETAPAPVAEMTAVVVAETDHVHVDAEVVTDHAPVTEAGTVPDHHNKGEDHLHVATTLDHQRSLDHLHAINRLHAIARHQSRSQSRSRDHQRSLDHDHQRSLDHLPALHQSRMMRTEGASSCMSAVLLVQHTRTLPSDARHSARALEHRGLCPLFMVYIPCT